MMSDDRVSKVSSAPEAPSEGQEWRADRYATHARFVADLGAPVLDLLARADSIALIPRPTPLPTDLGGWLDTFAGGFLSSLPANQRLAARDAVVSLLTPVLRDSRGRWTLDYVRLRFAARLFD